nr:DUF4982 domain-containing protein [Bacteroidales bacterium]
MKKIILLFLGIFLSATTALSALRSQDEQHIKSAQGVSFNAREHLLMDQNWKFAFGHPYDAKKDYYHATGYFSYITKAGYGDGPAAADFNDKPWRIVDLPHDWAVEQPFDGSASHSHGYKTVGPKFPDTSVGWYRKAFNIPESDLGKRISIQFDGVHRNAKVWINGFFLGTESSGYFDFVYDITPYLNYGGENVISVRVDVSLEEGWFYEGAGIYRHVWLNKTNPLHIDYNGVFVTSTIEDGAAILKVESTVVNETDDERTFEIEHELVDKDGKITTIRRFTSEVIQPHEKKELEYLIDLDEHTLWSLDNPYLYEVRTSIYEGEKKIDDYATTFGIRTIRFDPDLGFFLNGESVKVKGTCNHQDHAGVGTAIPDALQEFRIERLKSMGANAYRSSHNPPTPELLDACDRLGMLVMCENRLMGTSPEILGQLSRLIKRDRNHPSIFIWSLGNEEWAIEGNEKGTRIGAEMQDFARKLDPSRPYTVAASGGWGHGVDISMEIMGFNYLSHGNIDEHHKEFPNQPSIGSEEATTRGTRGIFEDNFEIGHMAPTDRVEDGSSIETGWEYFAKREFLSGLFFWTGFDYRGESNPLNYPAISSQFGIMDVCGFPKQSYYYLQAKWSNEPVLHIASHWNWEGKEGELINVRVQSNCEEVELFLNGISLGRKEMNLYSHLEWDVNYKKGKLEAKGYNNGKKVVENKVETAGESASIQLIANRSVLDANGEDVSVITVKVNDSKGRFMPLADELISFEIDGPGRIIGVGNGNPGCHEADTYYGEVNQILIKNSKISVVEVMEQQAELLVGFDDSGWPAHRMTREQMIFPPEKTIVVRADFTLSGFTKDSKFVLHSKSLADGQDVYVNGHLIAENIKRGEHNQSFTLDHSVLKEGKNLYAIIGSPMQKRSEWDELNIKPGLIQIINPEPASSRSVFN